MSARRRAALVVGIVVVGLCAVWSRPAAAHAPQAVRTLRLQLRDGALEGLLVYRLPVRAAAPYLAAPRAAVALVPAATAGLVLTADGVRLQPRVREARSSRTDGGGLEARLLLEIGAVRAELRVAVEEGPPLPVLLVAQSGVKLRLIAGPGRAVPGGLELRPRPGVPCAVAISRPAARGMPR